MGRRLRLRVRNPGRNEVWRRLLSDSDRRADVALQFLGNLFEYFLVRKNEGKTGRGRSRALRFSEWPRSGKADKLEQKDTILPL